MPTFGKTTDGASSSSSTAIKAAVSSASPAETGIVIAASAQLGFSAATDTRFLIYPDSSGDPGSAPLAVADAPFPELSGALAWRDFTFSGNNMITISPSVTYWIGPAWEGGTSTTFGRDSTASMRREGTLSAWPTFTSPSWAAAQTGPMAAYVTYLLPSGETRRMHAPARFRAATI